MSHFRRVQDTLGTADYLSKALDGDYQEDKYAHLRSTDAERKQTIAQKKGEFRGASKKEPKAWERETKATVYKDMYFPTDESQYLDSESYEDTAYSADPRSIRRAGNATDQPLTARALETQLKAFSKEDYMQVMLRGASIFNPDMEEIKEAFKISQNDPSEQENTREAAEIRRSYANDAWEAEKRKEYNRAGAKGNKILRTSADAVAAGDFSTIAWSALDDEREEIKLRMRENKRMASAAIKRKGQSREDQHRMWEKSFNPMAQTFDDYYGDNIDMDVLIIK